MGKFENKVIVITGAGGVLCGAFAKALAKEGAKVAVLDLRKDAADKVADEIKAEGGIAEGFACNVLVKDSIVQCHEEVVAKFGKCDILINGAGGNNPKATTDDEFFDPAHLDSDVKDFFHIDEGGFDFVFNLNIKGTLLPTQVFARDMIGNPEATILNVSSMNAFTPLTKIPAYSAAKAGVSNFTKWLATHFAPAGIRVNAIAPGFFVTAQNQALLFNADGTPTARTGKILRNTPMGRFGKPEELVGAVEFLLDFAASSFITGVVLPIDGGFSAYSGV